MSAFQVHLAGTLSLQQIHFANLPVFNLIRDLLTRKKKESVKVHTFGPDPPLKSVKHNNFFSHTLTETYFGKRNLFFHL